jgi:hypothetical protein
MAHEVWVKDTSLDEGTIVESTIAINYDARERVTVTRDKMTRLLVEAGYLPREETEDAECT